jgi:cytochrome P450
MLRRNPLECWTEAFFEEPIAKVKLPFVEAVLVHDPNAIRHVLVDNAGKDPIQQRILSSGLAEGLLGVEGDRWSVQRRTLAPLFTRRTVGSFADAMLEGADQLSARLLSLPPGNTVDLAGEFTLLTLNVLALTIFSDGICEDFDGFRSAMNTYFDFIGRINVLDLLGAPSILPRSGGRRLRQTMAFFESTIDRIIATRQRRLEFASNSPAPEDLLTLLLRALDPSTGRPTSVAEVRSNILTFLSAGHETTANALAWSTFLLSQSPHWSARVREEADRELAGERNVPCAFWAPRRQISRALPTFRLAGGHEPASGRRLPCRKRSWFWRPSSIVSNWSSCPMRVSGRSKKSPCVPRTVCRCAWRQELQSSRAALNAFSGCRVGRQRAALAFRAANNRYARVRHGVRVGACALPCEGLLLELLHPAPLHAFHDIFGQVARIHEYLDVSKSAANLLFPRASINVGGGMW